MRVPAVTRAVLVGRALRLPPRLCLLIGVGTAICGNTAIVTTAPVIRADEKEVSFAIATITVFGMLAVMTYPWIGRALEMAPPMFGAWCGLAVNDTSQVVAAASAYGGEALDVATVVKLVRNALMAPLVVGLALFERRRHSSLTDRVAAAPPTSPVPPFVVGFLGLAALRTFGVIDATIAGHCETVAKALILCALAGVGLSTRFGELRHVGLRPLLLGLLIAALIAALALATVHAVPFGA